MSTEFRVRSTEFNSMPQAMRAQRVSLRTPHSAVRTAFTTIEIMTAVAIMVLLLSIFAFAFRNVGTSAGVNQTRNVLEQLRNAVGEATKDKASAHKFFAVQMPRVYETSVNTDEGAADWAEDQLPVPTNDAQRAQALAKTKRITALLQSNTTVRGFFDGLQAAQKRSERVNVLDAAERDANGQPGRAVPVFLDHWGNPILFVPDNIQEPKGTNIAVPAIVAGSTPPQTRGGLSGLKINKTKPADPTDGDDLPGVGGILRSPDQRPFWFSAGPDGNYQTHDDNIYSFEN